MAPEAGYRILKKKITGMLQDEQNALKESGKALWLLRESNTKGMLTVDMILWSKEENNWKTKSTRMVLSDNGWINASNVQLPEVQEALQSAQHITAETAGLHEATLFQYIENYDNGMLILENRINPSKNEQTTSPILSLYQVRDISRVPLTPGVLQSLTCDITGQIFTNPVVMNVDQMVRNRDGEDIRLYKGRTYEESALQALRVNPQVYYVNKTLKDVINRLGSADNAKIASLEEDWLKDPVSLETLIEPMILPSTHSLSKDTVEGMIASGRTLQCPMTRIPFTREQVISNENLDHFIQAWPECKALLVPSLSSSSRSKL